MLEEVYSVRVDSSTAQALEAAAKASGLSTSEAHRLALGLFIAAVSKSLNDGALGDGHPE